MTKDKVLCSTCGAAYHGQTPCNENAPAFVKQRERQEDDVISIALTRRQWRLIYHALVGGIQRDDVRALRLVIAEELGKDKEVERI